MPKLDLTRAARIKGQGGEYRRLRGPDYAWMRPAASAGWSVTPGDGSAMVDAFPPVLGPWSISPGDGSATILMFPEPN